MKHSSQYLSEVSKLAKLIKADEIEKMAQALCDLRDRGGRLFFLGLGGSAANASHAVNDFRKLCNIEAYAPTDNVAELTARANDEGWTTIFSEWLAGSRACQEDGLFVLSVGGGTNKVSKPLKRAIHLVLSGYVEIFGIVGRDGGYTKKKGDHVIVIPTINKKHITPHTEAFQLVILHCLVSHPLLQKSPTKW